MYHETATASHTQQPYRYLYTFDLTFLAGPATGAQKEVDHWPIFLELARLLPRTHLRVVLAGPDAPQRLDGASCLSSPSQMLTAVPLEPADGHAQHVSSGTHRGCSVNDSSAKPQNGQGGEQNMQPRGSEATGSLHLCFRRGMGHDLLPALAAQYGHIDLVFGPNAGEPECCTLGQLVSSACLPLPITRTLPLRRWSTEFDCHDGRVSAGLAAYASWQPTLDALARPGGPACVFTDFCEEAAVLGAKLLATASASAGFPNNATHISILYMPARITASCHSDEVSQQVDAFEHSRVPSIRRDSVLLLVQEAQQTPQRGAFLSSSIPSGSR